MTDSLYLKTLLNAVEKAYGSYNHSGDLSYIPKCRNPETPHPHIHHTLYTKNNSYLEINSLYSLCSVRGIHPITGLTFTFLIDFSNNNRKIIHHLCFPDAKSPYIATQENTFSKKRDLFSHIEKAMKVPVSYKID